MSAGFSEKAEKAKGKTQMKRAATDSEESDLSESSDSSSSDSDEVYTTKVIHFQPWAQHKQ